MATKREYRHHVPCLVGVGPPDLRPRSAACVMPHPGGPHLPPLVFWLGKLRRPEDRIGDVHEGSRREHADIERQLHANFHDLRLAEAVPQGPFDHPTDRLVVLPLDHRQSIIGRRDATVEDTLLRAERPSIASRNTYRTPVAPATQPRLQSPTDT